MKKAMPRNKIKTVFKFFKLNILCLILLFHLKYTVFW